MHNNRVINGFLFILFIYYLNLFHVQSLQVIVFCIQYSITVCIHIELVIGLLVSKVKLGKGKGSDYDFQIPENLFLSWTRF